MRCSHSEVLNIDLLHFSKQIIIYFGINIQRYRINILDKQTDVLPVLRQNRLPPRAEVVWLHPERPCLEPPQKPEERRGRNAGRPEQHPFGCLQKLGEAGDRAVASPETGETSEDEEENRERGGGVLEEESVQVTLCLFEFGNIQCEKNLIPQRPDLLGSIWFRQFFNPKWRICIFCINTRRPRS
ncbi:Hypothetical_protein [Hexamita inflata]|uniref:Hypothetical_protein n=1 Tax=Hexamita inflata TaxID=28002 RepID=A0AA86U2J1_9EUKA|nr:Hypothetical protein HINF_LOCUS25649 [Hexamita inflata]